MKSKNKNVSFFSNVKSQFNIKTTLELIFNDIQSGRWKTEIEQMRFAKHNEKDEMYSELKKNLNCFTTSLTYKDKRDKNLVLEYNGIMSLDYDGLPRGEIDDIRNSINADHNTFCCFLSPSGLGFKIFVKIDSNSDNHKIAFNQVSDYYDELLKIDSDKSCKDKGRLCFVSYDNNLFLNKNSITFKVRNKILEIKKVNQKISREGKIAIGGRNTHLTSMAGSMNRKGLSYDSLLAALMIENQQKFTEPLPEYEVISICKSITSYESEEPLTPKFKQEKPIEDSFYNSLPESILTDFIDIITPHSESSKMGLAFSFLTSLGNIIGRKIYHKVESDKHYSNLFMCLVGGTSTGRKGTSWGRVKSFFKLVDSDWVSQNIKGGLYNGVGLIHSVRDEKKEYSKKEKVEVIVDTGVIDKRLLAVQTEFVTVLNLSKGDSNIISSVLRDAWDGGTLTTLIKNSRDIATNPHISIIGHITPTELNQSISKSDLSNGFANRFLWVFVEMTKELPFGGDLDDSELIPIAEKVKDIIKWVNSKNEIKMIWDEEAKGAWIECYSDLVKDFDGVLGTVTSRAAPQVLRLTILFAIMDKNKIMSKKHLESALILWRYSLQSADYIFGNNMNGKIQNKILVELENKKVSLTKTEIHKLFNNHIPKGDIDTSLSYLLQIGKISKRKEQTNGKPKTIYYLNEDYAKKEN